MAAGEHILNHVVGVGGGAAGIELAQGAVDQRGEVGPIVSNPRQTLNAAVRRSMDTTTELSEELKHKTRNLHPQAIKLSNYSLAYTLLYIESSQVFYLSWLRLDSSSARLSTGFRLGTSCVGGGGSTSTTWNTSQWADW